jgi:hypothetical protein
MKPFCASILPLLTLVLACSNTQSPTSGEPTSAASASFANAPSGSVAVVTRTDEGDVGVDGTVDGRAVITTWYDAHGKVTKEVLERTLPTEEAVRTTTVYQYNTRGAEIGHVVETDIGADGTVDSRSTLLTVETDKRGDPIKQTITYSGAFVSVSDVVNEFDARGRVIRSVLGPLTTTYGYDSHDNLIFYQTEISQGGSVRTTTLEYNVHDALERQDGTLLLDGVLRPVYALSTVAHDEKGYPVRQVIQGNYFAGSPQRSTRAITYDSHHKPLTQIEDVDYDADGNIDFRGVSRWEYQGQNDVPFRQGNATAAALEPGGDAQTFSPSDPGSGTSTERGGKRGPVSSF